MIPPQTEVYHKLRCCELRFSASTIDTRNPSGSLGIPMMFLPILRYALSSDSASCDLPSAQLTPETLMFLRKFNDSHLHNEVYPKLRFCDLRFPASTASTVDPRNPLVSRRISMIFLPHTEVYPKLRFCDLRFSISTIDPAILYLLPEFQRFSIPYRGQP